MSWGWLLITKIKPDKKLLELIGWKWPQNRWEKVEYACPHGIGHGEGVHGCDGCCGDESYQRAKLLRGILIEKKKKGKRRKKR